MIGTGATFHAIIVFVVAGLITGIIYDILSIFKFITKRNILVVNVVDLLVCIAGFSIFIYCLFKFEYGEIAFFELVSFAFGIIFEQIFIKNLFASPIKFVYNKITSRKWKKYFLRKSKEKGEFL